MQQVDNNAPHRGRFGQIPIYVGKFFRMFILANDWKVIPMAAIIAALVAKVAANNMFLTQEGTIYGALALACVCIWNGCFNSIQVVCREREIVKREHRDGMHITSYVAAHMIYQGFLCACQSAVTVLLCHLAGLKMPVQGFMLSLFDLEIGITIFLMTYAADMLALMISCIVHDTTTAMTVMPFVLICQLLFSGSMFALSGAAEKMTSFTIAKWGINALCAQAKFNDLPMVTIWNQLQKFGDVGMNDEFNVKKGLDYLIQSGNARKLTEWMGRFNQREEFASTVQNLTSCWVNLAGIAVFCAVIAVLALKRIDRDKR